MRKELKRRIQLLLLFCLVIIGVYYFPGHTVYAATGVEIAAVEYYEEQVVILNNGNSKIYFATEVEAARDNWEVVDADVNVNAVTGAVTASMFTMIDISWLSPSVENILVFKGDQDQTQTRAIIGDKPEKLELSFIYSNIDNLKPDDSIASLVNIMSSVGTGEKPITFDDLEWRKGDTGQWISTRYLTVGLLRKYLVKGTYLYFRVRAVDDVVTAVTNNGTLDFNSMRIEGIPGGIRAYEKVPGFYISNNFPNGTRGRRFSNEVKVKIAKQSVSAASDIDGEKFTIEMKYGKEYRITADAKSSTWIQITDRTVRSLYLSKMLLNVNANSSYNGTTVAFPAIKLEIRDYATSKAVSSKITEIILKQQRTMVNNPLAYNQSAPDLTTPADNNIYMSYNGNKNVVLEIPSASLEQPYEYCAFKQNVAYDNDKAVWTPITKNTEVKILASKAVEGGTLYIRKKEIQAKGYVDYEMASTYVSHTIDYPSIPDIADASFTFTKGYSGDITFPIILNVSPKVAFETEIASIKLGTKDIEFYLPTTSGSTMTVILKASSLATLTNCSSRPIVITFKKGTVDKTSIKLTIQSPTASGALTITTAKGTNTGTTKFTVVTPQGSGNHWTYTIGDTVISGVNTQDIFDNKINLTQTTFTPAVNDNIPTGLNQYLTIFELDSTNHIIKFKCIQITSNIRS